MPLVRGKSVSEKGKSGPPPTSMMWNSRCRRLLRGPVLNKGSHPDPKREKKGERQGTDKGKKKNPRLGITSCGEITPPLGARMRGVCPSKKENGQKAKGSSSARGKKRKRKKGTTNIPQVGSYMPQQKPKPPPPQTQRRYSSGPLRRQSNTTHLRY